MIAIGDSVASELMEEAQAEFKKKKLTLNGEIDKHNKEKVANLITINNLKNISQNSSRYQRMDEIWKSKDIVKTMVDELIQEIVLFRPNPSWVLVVVRYKNNVEMWGTLKSKKYKKSEMFYDENNCNHGIEFHTWIINNTDHHFGYNRQNKTFTYDGHSDIYNNIDAGTYTFEQLHKILYDKEWIGSYPFYCYENNEYNINPPARNSKIPIMPSRWIHTHSTASE